MVEDGAFSHIIDYVTIFKEILNLEGLPNCITGLKVLSILLIGWILSFSGASAVEGRLLTNRGPGRSGNCLISIRQLPD